MDPDPSESYVEKIITFYNHVLPNTVDSFVESKSRFLGNSEIF